MRLMTLEIFYLYHKASLSLALNPKSMATLYLNQAKEYANARPTYPPQLFQFIASHTPSRDLAWDVGTGSGQAARSLAEIYTHVIATDVSEKQLEFAPKLTNVRYQQTSPVMSMAELEQKVAKQSSVDLVTIAQAMHWFDLSTFYKQVKWVLKKPHGVIAAWCYTLPQVSKLVDTLTHRFILEDRKDYGDERCKLIVDKYRSIDFPFESVEGAEHTGPFEFEAETVMNLEDFFTYLRSGAAYQIAKGNGVELLGKDVMEEFKHAWDESGSEHKVVKFPIYLRIGRVGQVQQA